MQKQINPEIFGMELPTLGSKKSTSSPSLDQILRLDQKIAELRGALNQLKDVFEAFKKEQNLQWNSFKKALETLGQSLKILEQNDQKLANQVTQKQNHILQIRHEMQNWEGKLQELIQKHQMIIRSYDVKIQHLQNLIQQKEQLLISYQAQLNEAKNEISRLKKA